MTAEQSQVLRNLFTQGILAADPQACRADLLRDLLEQIERKNMERAPGLYASGSGKLEGQIGCLPSEALNALVAFYLEYRELED